MAKTARGIRPCYRSTVYEYDRQHAEELPIVLCEATSCSNLAGVNRPKDASEFMEGNFGFARDAARRCLSTTATLPGHARAAVQATLRDASGASTASPSSRARSSSSSTASARAPRCSSTVSPTSSASGAGPTTTAPSPLFVTTSPTTCPYTVNDPSVELELLYIDDLVEEMFDLL